MKQVAIVWTMLAVGCLTFAQAGGTSQPKTPPPQNAPSGQSAQGTAGTAQPEYDAFNAANAAKDPAEIEKAANDFAAKFPDSELRILLFKNATRAYQNANNADKMMEMAHKSLAIDPDDGESLVDVAEVLTERTRDTDLDRDQRLEEAKKNVERALQTIDTHYPIGVPADKLDAYKSLLRSSAYSIRGTLEYNKNDFKA